MSKELIFYTNPMSRGRIVRWMLEETGAAYSTEIIEYETSMKQEPYLSINPMGKVPSIKHRDCVVTECAAICAYLADAFPDAKLAPSIENRAEYYRWLFFAAGPVEQAIVNKSLGFTPTADQGRMAGYGSFERTVRVMELAVSGQEYIAGDSFSAADVCLGAQIGWGLQFGTLPESDVFSAYMERLFARPAYKKATEIDDGLTSPQPG